MSNTQLKNSHKNLMTALTAMWAVATQLIEKSGMNGDNTLSDAMHEAWQTAAAQTSAALAEGEVLASTQTTPDDGINWDAQRSLQVKVFARELLDSVGTFGAIAETYGTDTLAQLFSLILAILNDSYIDRYPSEIGIIELIGTLPSSKKWLAHIVDTPDETVAAIGVPAFHTLDVPVETQVRVVVAAKYLGQISDEQAVVALARFPAITLADALNDVLNRADGARALFCDGDGLVDGQPPAAFDASLAGR